MGFLLVLAAALYLLAPPLFVDLALVAYLVEVAVVIAAVMLLKPGAVDAVIALAIALAVIAPFFLAVGFSLQGMRGGSTVGVFYVAAFGYVASVVSLVRQLRGELSRDRRSSRWKLVASYSAVFVLMVWASILDYQVTLWLCLFFSAGYGAMAAIEHGARSRNASILAALVSGYAALMATNLSAFALAVVVGAASLGYVGYLAYRTKLQSLRRAAAEEFYRNL